MLAILFIALFIALAYLLGSINCAVIVCKMAGLSDPRTQGSKNPGATNVLRLGGKKLALLVAIGDILKGVLPVLVANLCGVDGFWLGLVALAAVLGHMYPVFFGFQGGKGVATALGAIFALSWFVGILVLLTWGVIALVFRRSSLSSLVSIALAIPFIFFFADPMLALPVLVIALFIIYRHQGNIARLINGTEPKIGQKKPTP